MRAIIVPPRSMCGRLPCTALAPLPRPWRGSTFVPVDPDPRIPGIRPKLLPAPGLRIDCAVNAADREERADMLAQVGSFVLGVILLTLGADSFARGVGGLALRSGMSAFGVGLASTALGAIVPALAVMLAAGYARAPELALGSLVGGSIAQIGLVLGLGAIAAPLRARLKLFTRANPAMIAAGVLLWLLSLDARLGPIDGIVLIVAWLVVAALVVRD